MQKLVLLLFLALAAWQSALHGDTMKTRIIINPKSGTDGKQHIEKLLEQHLDRNRFEWEIIHTAGPNHALRLSKEAAASGFGLVIAVGGDGTVNEVGRGLIGTQTAIGIIPCGSGNGLAKHLGIPTDPLKAIHLINQLQYKPIDTVQVNDDYFLGIAGIGFDAHIAWKFAQSERRGFWSYAALVLRDYPSYPSQVFDMVIDGKTVRKAAFLVSFANSSQYGNDILIAPQAKLNDGVLNLVILKKPPFYAVPGLLLALRRGTIQPSKYYESIPCKEVTIRQANLIAHVDGEPTFFKNGLHLKVLPRSLNVVSP